MATQLKAPSTIQRTASSPEAGWVTIGWEAITDAQSYELGWATKTHWVENKETKVQEEVPDFDNDDPSLAGIYSSGTNEITISVSLGFPTYDEVNDTVIPPPPFFVRVMAVAGVGFTDSEWSGSVDIARLLNGGTVEIGLVKAIPLEAESCLSVQDFVFVQRDTGRLSGEEVLLPEDSVRVRTGNVYDPGEFFEIIDKSDKKKGEKIRVIENAYLHDIALQREVVVGEATEYPLLRESYPKEKEKRKKK